MIINNSNSFGGAQTTVTAVRHIIIGYQSQKTGLYAVLVYYGNGGLPLKGFTTMQNILNSANKNKAIISVKPGLVKKYSMKKSYIKNRNSRH